jgi:hypothetical protein
LSIRRRRSRSFTYDSAASSSIKITISGSAGEGWCSRVIPRSRICLSRIFLTLTLPSYGPIRTGTGCSRPGLRCGSPKPTKYG